jgi:hypothetical protein
LISLRGRETGRVALRKPTSKASTRWSRPARDAVVRSDLSLPNANIVPVEEVAIGLLCGVWLNKANGRVGQF